ncbi:hypothetical protein CVT26_009585 [Gymnopilus dilepis]|uniref:Uncharacterized protein n=1 Tax=Gymnopilus dilepis TaxID=231916 RepID=A0A409YIE2_9AGAR|nr:hypothetical protein CVT26_009585 [Gymnopilus dilepis]
MTKSQGFSAHRRAYIKSVRAKAHREGTSFKTTLENVSYTKAAKKARLHTDNLYTYEPRNVRRQWYSDAVTVEDRGYDVQEEDVYDFAVDFDADVQERHTDLNVQLLDIARPVTKRKGDFEIIPKTRSSLCDEEFEIWEDHEFEVYEEDWEKIYDEEEFDAKRTYSAVLRGNDR